MIFSKKLGEAEILSQVDQYRLSFVFAIDIRNREFEYFQYKRSSLDEATWKSYKDLILMNHATEQGRVWWEKIGRGIVNPKFGEMVDDMLANHPTDGTWDTLATGMKGSISLRSSSHSVTIKSKKKQLTPFSSLNMQCPNPDSSPAE
jgi:hypothetical protein